MAQEQASAAVNNLQPLYDWWLQTLPALMRGGASGRHAAAEPGHERAGPLPYPVDRVAAALEQTRGMLDSLYGGVLRTLMASQPQGELHAFELFVRERIAAISEQFTHLGDATSGPADLAQFTSRFAVAPLAAVGDALKPWSLNVERAYGGLVDAFGLAPLRELEQAGRDAAEAALARQHAQADYLGVVADALVKASRTLSDQLAEMGRRGESVDSMLALTRLWARATDEALHDALQSPRGLNAAAQLLRTASISRQQQQRVVALVSQALNVPTRAEVDDAYREIQELKRELRRLRKRAEPVATSPAPVPAAAAPAPRKAVRARNASKGPTAS
jgi:hypothetical protein